MPEISRFYGIRICMYFKPKEHEPSHVHAYYNEFSGEFNIQTLEMLPGGTLPRKAQKLVQEWIMLHQVALQQMWDSQVFEELPPLD